MSKLAIRAYKLFAVAFRSACVIVVVSSFSGCFRGGKTDTNSGNADTVVDKVDSSPRQVPAGQDTSKKQSYIPPEISEEAMQKAIIYRRDSSFHVYNNIRADYRIIGYESPDTNSRKMVLFSVFTSDVKGNPFHCPYGSYYDSAQGDKLVIKYNVEHGSFIEANISGGSKKPATVYFEKKWVEFVDGRKL